MGRRDRRWPCCNICRSGTEDGLRAIVSLKYSGAQGIVLTVHGEAGAWGADDLVTGLAVVVEVSKGDFAIVLSDVLVGLDDVQIRLLGD